MSNLAAAGDAVADQPVFVLILLCRHRNFGSMDSDFGPVPHPKFDSVSGSTLRHHPSKLW